MLGINMVSPGKNSRSQSPLSSFLTLSEDGSQRVVDNFFVTFFLLKFAFFELRQVVIHGREILSVYSVYCSSVLFPPVRRMILA